jgi:hypothetical protein
MLLNKNTKQVLFGVTVIAVASVLAHLYVVSQSYYPVVQISSPDGLVFTAVQDPTSERSACSAANKRFLGPIKKQCEQCKVVLARCERELEEFELSVYEGRALAHHQVFATGLRLAIDGPQPVSKASCELMAGELLKRGVRPAACLYPRLAKEKAPG